MLVQSQRIILPETVEDNFDFADVRIFGQWLYLHDIYQEVILIFKTTTSEYYHKHLYHKITKLSWVVRFISTW